MTDRPTPAAERARDEARARLSETLGEIQHRLAPSTIVEDVIGDVRQRASGAVATVKARPVLAATVAGLLGLLLIRKPLTRAVTKRFSKARET